MIKTAAGKIPEIADGAYIAENAVITGDVTVMTSASIWFGAVLRGDSGKITIGERVNIQDNVVIHEETFIDHDVTVGHCAILHGCRVEPHCLIGMHATVMDEAVIGEGSVIGAGALIPKGKIIPPGSVVMGVPGKVVSTAPEDFIDHMKEVALHYIDLAEGQLAKTE